MKCQDNCLYYELCRDSGFLMYHTRIKKTLTLTENVEKECPFKKFKNKADVVEVKHGEWLMKHLGAGHFWECSECKFKNCVMPRTNYCPECGAKMDGRRDA